MIFKTLLSVWVIFSILPSHSFAASNYTPEFSDELSRVGIRVEPDDADAMEILSQTGVSTIRYALNWHKFEPNKGNWDTNYIDNRISLLKNSHINSMIGVGVNNVLYSGDSDIRCGVETRENLEAFSNYCLKLGEYLANNYPEINEFLIWNEPNSASFWKSTPNPSSYYNLVKEASIAFKQSIPDCTIIAGVAANPSIQFLSQLYSLGIYRYADMISAQPYVAPSNVDEGTFEYRLGQYNALTDQYGGWKENYISEIGWHTYANDNTIGVSEDAQAENIIKTFALADEYDMSGVNLYELIDGTNNVVKSENYYGLIKSDFTPKKGFDSLIYYQDVIGGADYAGKLTNNDGNAYAYIYHKNGKIIAIAWSQNEATPLSELNINEYTSASNIYGNIIDSPSLSHTPIYLELSDSSLLYEAIKASIKKYYSAIPDLCLTPGIVSLKNTDIISMSKEEIRVHFENHYTEATNLINQYKTNLISDNLSIYLMSADKLHNAAEKLGILCMYLSPQQTDLNELSSDTNILSARTQIENPEHYISFKANLNGIELGDTVTLTITDEKGSPRYVNQKTFGSGVEHTLDITLDTTLTNQYSGKISSRVSNPVITSITESNPYWDTTFQNDLFAVTATNPIKTKLKEFIHEYPYAQAILKQAEQYNRRAHTLNNSLYESTYKASYVDIADFIATKLSELSVKVAAIETADFDKGFSIVTTPSIINSGGIVHLSAEITNKNAIDFDGTIEVLDNHGNVLSTMNKVISNNATETVSFDIAVPQQTTDGQYFYYLNLTKKETTLSSKAIYINTQIGPYPSVEIVNENQVADTPPENKFSIDGVEYILLDTTNDTDSKFFIMEENISKKGYFDPDQYDIDVDPYDSNNIVYYLNHNYPIHSIVKNYINTNHLWLTEAGYGDSVCPTDYTVKCGINLLSVQEWNTYAGKFGYAPSGFSTNTWWLRTPGTNINTIRYVSKLSGNCLHTYTNSEQRGIRPVYYLHRDFFKKVKPDSMGSNVIDTIKRTYSANELISGCAYTKDNLIHLGIAEENDFLLTEIQLTNAEGKPISSPEHHQDINLKIKNDTPTLFTAILAIYDSENNLIACSSSQIETSGTIHLVLPEDAPTGAFAKLFMWEFSTLTPLDVPIIFHSFKSK